MQWFHQQLILLKKVYQLKQHLYNIVVFSNTDKFWVPSDIEVLEAAGNSDETSNNAITFANIKQEPISVIVRQAANTAGFEMTAREWYGEGNVPDGIEDLEYVSDYMVDVFVFKGSYDSEKLQNDPTYGSFFNEHGLHRDQLAKFTALREVSLVAQYTGSVIPEFQDQEVVNYTLRL